MCDLCGCCTLYDLLVVVYVSNYFQFPFVRSPDERHRMTESQQGETVPGQTTRGGLGVSLGGASTGRLHDKGYTPALNLQHDPK